MGDNELSRHVTRYARGMAGRVVTAGNAEDCALSLYPIPRAESIPREKWEIVNDPIFRADELTPDAVHARADTNNDTGDISGPRMHFSVLFDGDILVEIRSKGVSPDWLYDQLVRLR